jgi:osmotically-inducible protein OsmY
MSVATPINRDRDIRSAVEAELEWTPDVDGAGIGVAVDDGVVSLSGEVDSFAERIAAKRAALRVRGVTTVIDDLRVHPDSRFSISETDVGKEVERALGSTSNVPDTVKAEIHGHDVTLTGEVTWDFQRRAAKRAVQYLRGVQSVKNLITLTPRVSAVDTQERIERAILRNAQLDADAIKVSVAGGEVTLTGTVRSWAEKQQAEHAAWSSPHVSGVDDRILVRAV